MRSYLHLQNSVATSEQMTRSLHCFFYIVQRPSERQQLFRVLMLAYGHTFAYASADHGHKTRSVFDRYHIVASSDLRDTARKLETNQKQERESLESPARRSLGTA